MSHPFRSPKPVSSPQPRFSNRLWFSAGFLLVCVSMLLFVRMVALHPSGRYAVRCTLWQYYVIEIPSAIRGTGNLGPGGGAARAIFETAAVHGFFSALGGFALLAIVWGIRRARRPMQPPA
jgi:hypothetical protein